MTAGPSVHLVILDNDGVLVDSDLVAREAVAEALVARGLAVTALDICARCIGLSAASMFRDIEAHYGLAVAAADREVTDRTVYHGPPGCLPWGGVVLTSGHATDQQHRRFRNRAIS
jgi:phosphoglycolate phosphatase-like HAD superfamily hydrolase